MRGNYTFTKGEDEYSLSDCVEFFALDICEDLAEKKRIEEIMQKCKILNSLSNALMAIKS